MSSDATNGSDPLDRIREVADAARQRKAADLRVLDLSRISDFTDYFLICSGTNERQVQAIGDAVGERMAKLGVRPLSIEGRTQGRWILLDYGSFLVHIFQKQVRSFYRLESLWADGTDVTDQVER